VIRLLRRKPQPSKVAVHVEVPVLHGEAEEAELTAAIDESKSAVALGTAVEAPSEERGTRGHCTNAEIQGPGLAPSIGVRAAARASDGAGRRSRLH
jgi:hypothetical protein